MGGSFLCLFQLLVTPEFLGCGLFPLISASVCTWPRSLHALSSPDSWRTAVVGFRAHPGNPEGPHLQILNYICKDPVSHQGHTFGGHFNPRQLHGGSLWLSHWGFRIFSS